MNRFIRIAMGGALAAMGCSGSPTEAPKAPGAVSAVGGKHQVALHWSPSSGANSYSVFRDEQVVATIRGTVYDDTGLAAATTYTYSVVSANAAGKSPPSTHVAALTVPDAPAQLTASPTASGVSLSWAPSPGAASYAVLRSASPQGPFTDVNFASGTTAIDAPASGGWGLFFYVVRARNESGGSDDSPASSARWVPVDSRDGDGDATLSWPAAPGASGYRVLRSPAAGGPYGAIGTTNGTSFTDSIANGTPWFYVIETVAAEPIRSPEVRVLALPVCVTSLGSNNVQVYRRGQSRSEPPLRQFGDRTGLVQGFGLAIDPVHGEVWTTEQGGPSEATSSFSRTATGNVAPSARSSLSGRAVVADPGPERVIVASFGFFRVLDRGAHELSFVEAPALGFAQSAAIDPVRSEVWVSDGSTPPSLQAYALVDIYSGQPGIAPVRTISGAASLLDQGVEGIAVDATNGEIAVALNAASSVIVFDAAANGSNVAPKRIVAGVASPHGVALDPVHDELWISSPAGLSVFARTADGTPAPIRTVTGPATGLDDPGSLALDLVDDEVTVMNRTWGAGLATFARTASGNAVPQRTISGRAEGINLPTAIAADPVTGEIFVANHAPDVVTVHAHGASGAGGPVRTLNLAANKLLVDAAHRELLAVSAGALLVYPLTATGNDPPARTIPTPAPVRGIAIAGDEILVSDGFSTVYVLGRDGTLLSSFSTGFARELAYDSTTDEVAVQGNATDPFWITFYSRSGGSPRRSIPLEHFGPFGVSLALDSITGDTWILVSEPEAQNPSLGRIAIYPRDSGAAGAMVRSIEGPASGMVEPSAITFCP